MRAKVVETFLDKYDANIVYNVGDVVDFDDERVKDLTDRQLVIVIDAEDEKPKKATRRKK